MSQRFYYRPGHPKANERGFVEAADLGDWGQEKKALYAPIVMDRFYENTSTIDGTDIGSRRKYKEYLRKTGYTNSSDFTNEWKKAAEERAQIQSGEHDKKERREAVGRAMYERFKP
jgi:hypothetical protein